GGDDFDDLLLEHLEKSFQAQHGIDLRSGHPAAHARLWWAAEEAKMRLSAEPYVTVREEALIVENGVPLNFELEIAREDFEGMIRPLIESTLESVSRALLDAGKKPSDLDAILLVGGSTRIPLVSRVLHERSGIEPRQDVHPDLAVALGAGVLASRLAGFEVERVLVDVSPYSFGPSYLGERGGVAYPYCYHPIIYRNTPLPITRTERYFTSEPYQEKVDIEIYQGDDEDALRNILIGNFQVEGLKPTKEQSEVLCRMRLDIDGILHVTAIEKSTGKSKDITITNALHQKSAEEIREARDRLQALHTTRVRPDGDAWEEGEDGDDEPAFEDEETHGALAERKYAGSDAKEVASGSTGGKDTSPPDPEWDAARQRAESLVNRSRGILERMHEEDREEAIDLHEQIAAAVAAKERASLEEAVKALQEFLFFVEGK
ncbi:MAG: Hsp70 family protein, partial [Prosthecobacter sp.]|nr:Hsp70 family protein [Prosthecobacter sp.]